MEIHHSIHDTTVNYGNVSRDLPALCKSNDSLGITHRNQYGGASTSTFLAGSATFLAASRSSVPGEFSGYSNSPSSGFFSTHAGALIVPQTATAAANTAGDVTENEENNNCQVRSTISRKSETNNCAVMGSLTLPATADRVMQHTHCVISANGNRSSTDSGASSAAHINASGSSSNSDHSGVTIRNEANFSHSISKFDTEICSSCSEFIMDRTLLSVNSRFWHATCLRCSQCSLFLEQHSTCFVKNDSFFCKQCYNRRFGKKCSSCQRLIHATDWVRRARNFVYHLACFACDQCKRQLSTGEEFALQDCRLLCKQHYMELVEGECGQQKAKTKRVRTTFAEEQLAVLQTHFQIDSNPDGADLERIATMTGLSKRVTQVWFQNSRARQKKYQGSKKNRTNQNNSNSGQSSTDPCSSPKSPSGDSNDGMIFPTSVLTSVEDAMVAPEQRSILPTSI
ncbi:unnamed protein product [Thelazia callipaeda]|uniref:LIM/homeobox protein Awh n=1 Tax=Thelazia callipaeda TaxID=103827 RepID=A0A158RBN3_THECL|nr:unnamed protein product [Thelazia callipaeda]